MMSQADSRRGLWQVLAPALIAVSAAVLLFWGLTDKYLWEDEASTAVLAARMLKYGRPLSYDGVNLVTIDHFAAEDESTADSLSRDTNAAVSYYTRRGDYKSDTTWKWQPWGQFVTAAAGIALLGKTTLGARLPFAIAGFVTVLLLFRLVRRRFDSLPMATVAATLLLANAYWILHTRQCRYYALSSLLFLVTMAAFARWQRGGRYGAALFVAAAWCWFQVDFGTFWPIIGVLFIDAFLARRTRFWQSLAVGGALALSIAPFAVYYELWGRHSTQVGTWGERFWGNLANMNLYVAPVLVLLFSGLILEAQWKNLPIEERHLIAISCGSLVALAIWIPAVAPTAFLRYAIMAAPVGALLTAWLLFRLTKRNPWLVAAGTAVLVFTQWICLPMMTSEWFHGAPFLRSELAYMGCEVFGHRPDPNRLVIDWLRKNAAPADKILIDYEDVPLMYYLPNPIRGGIAAFGAEDDRDGPPRFLVLRRSVTWVHFPIFLREMNRYHWQPVDLNVPDLPWGNNPDPVAQTVKTSTAPNLIVERRVDDR